MILYSIGKRIKNFISVKVLSDFKIQPDKIISGEEFLKNKDKISDGIVCWHYDDGKIKSECSYKNNMLNGISTHYYKSGKVKAKENYKENKLEGLSIYYYESGRLMSEENYRSGKLINRRTFDSAGKITIEKSS